jgi:pimeloyl-ACP methyl ester carboxylesterase
MVGISDIPGLGDRDVVFWDQRSSGRSQPRLCPEYDESLNARRNEITRETGPAIRKPLIQLCIASLKAKNIDPTSYNTTSSAHDLAALKQALGYTKWIVYGASYGSLLAQEAMRVDPSGIESVILGQPVPPGDLNEADGPISMQRSLERVFRACVAQPECHTAFPTVEQDFYALYQALRERPYAFVTATGDSVVLHVDRFRSVVNDYLMRTPTLAQLPLLFHEMLRGDKLRAARVLVPSLAPARLSNRALANLVNCYDTDEATFNRMVDSANAQVKEPFRRSRESGECSMWQEGFSARARTPVVSEIPTLILAGEFDPRTPVEHGQRIARTLSRAYVFEVPGRSHQNPTPCERSMIAAFIADPVRKPDAACLASLPPITFQTHW